ncbi:MAG: hypothetical protein IJV86_02715 [Clostridia bacterium]|nr:hypothetical protein [Clostridia bacterium]
MRQRKALDEQLRADKEHCLKGKTSPLIARRSVRTKKSVSDIVLELKRETSL